MVPLPVANWLIENNYGAVVSIKPVGGGCINNGTQLTTQSGQSFFLKTNTQCPPDMFAREMEGLLALRTTDGPRVPVPFLHAPGFLLLEDLRPAPRGQDYWKNFGQQLAALHSYPHPRFGFIHNNYLGSTPQPNPLTEDGYTFFAQHRLNFQAELALQRGYLSKIEVQRIARLSSRLPEWVPDQPASLLHGDLWSGNMLTDELGNPALIDPATHYGWAEADLAMTALFGAPPGEFYHAYREARPIPPGVETRFPLYNLYHLLNHLNFFGPGYYGEAMAIVRRFG